MRLVLVAAFERWVFAYWSLRRMVASSATDKLLVSSWVCLLTLAFMALRHDSQWSNSLWRSVNLDLELVDVVARALSALGRSWFSLSSFSYSSRVSCSLRTAAPRVAEGGSVLASLVESVSVRFQYG